MFSKKQKTDSSFLATKAENAISVFQTTISELNAIATNADAAKAERQKEIDELQAEANKLSQVANDARGWASKLTNLFKSDSNAEW